MLNEGKRIVRVSSIDAPCALAYPTFGAFYVFLTGTMLGNLTDSYTYNDFGEVSRYLAKYSTADIFKTEFTRDKLGRITQKIETTGGITSTFDYDYDVAGRLIEVKLNGAVQSSYGYDDNGNRTGLNGNPIAHYDDQDRLLDYNGTTYEYTSNGELKAKAINTATTHYDYDVLGNLKKVAFGNGNTIDYLTDGQNRRIGKKVNGVLSQGWLYQDSLRPIAELDGNNQVVARFVYANKDNVPDYMVKAGATYRIVSDHLGSPRLIINIADNTVVQEMAYDVWGKVIQDSNPGFQPFGFAGGLYDPHTKLTRFGARDYDAQTGRWTAKDPIQFNGGDTNLFGYVSNDPVNFTDPLGLTPQGAAYGAAFGGSAVAAASVVVDAITGGLNIAATPAEIAAGAAAGAVVGDVVSDFVNNIYGVKNTVDPLDSAGGNEHTSGARPSTEGTHEKGSARKRQDRGREKGDESRDLPRRRPDGWKGPWPPKSCNN